MNRYRSADWNHWPGITLVSSFSEIVASLIEMLDPDDPIQTPTHFEKSRLMREFNKATLQKTAAAYKKALGRAFFHPKQMYDFDETFY